MYKELQLASWRLRTLDSVILIQIQRPEDQKNQWCSCLKEGRLNTQEELMFQLVSKGKKKIMSELDGYQSGGIPSYLVESQTPLPTPIQAFH